jgi:hypothetical protein
MSDEIDYNDELMAQIQESYEEKILFKYKAIETIEQLSHVLEILDDNKLYLAKCSELNDPFEGVINFIIENDKKDNDIDKKLNKERDKYRICSLSKDCFSKLMWSHYSDSFKGVCIGFYSYANNSFFQRAEEVSYRNDCFWSTDFGGIRASLTNKSKDWEYEQEERIITEYDENKYFKFDNNENKYFEFDNKDVACLIVGSRIEPLVKNILIGYCEKNCIPVFETKFDINKSDLLYIESKSDSKSFNKVDEITKYLYGLKEQDNS